VGNEVINKLSKIDGVILTPLNIIEVPGGNVLHGMKSGDAGYSDFGEAYFSMIEQGSIKAWKRHRQMVLNLIVPLGAVRFVIYDDRKNSTSNGEYQEVILSINNYCRLTVPPMLWMGFQGINKEENMLLNIASIEHIAKEADRKEMNDIKYNWRLEK
jgi:dTDP-4-dehydrorhamnose 3,5-epimerase